MSMLRQLPDFLTGMQLAKQGKWLAAKTDLIRATEVMQHANLVREANVCELYKSACSYYAGIPDEALRGYNHVKAQLSNAGMQKDKCFAVADRYSLGLADHAVAKGASSDDPWSTLIVGKIPESGYAQSVHEYISSNGGSALSSPTTSMERIGHAHALLQVASMRVSKLHVANADKIDTSTENTLISKALKAGEGIRDSGSAEMPITSKWFIGRSLVLRGRLFEFNANALMAEGMYRAAVDVSKGTDTPRTVLLRSIATDRLGKLLIKWEKREREGEELVSQANLSPNWEVLSNRFVAEPVLDELEDLV